MRQLGCSQTQRTPPHSLFSLTNDFLFARKKSADKTETDIDANAAALYSKPEDVWNIHDISSEYQETVAELIEVLNETGSPPTAE